MKEPSPLRSKVIEIADWFEKEAKSEYACRWIDLRDYSVLDQKKIQRNLRNEFRRRGKNYSVRRFRGSGSIQIHV